jgi:hypothetical protein
MTQAMRLGSRLLSFSVVEGGSVEYGHARGVLATSVSAGGSDAGSPWGTSCCRCIHRMVSSSTHLSTVVIEAYDRRDIHRWSRSLGLIVGLTLRSTSKMTLAVSGLALGRPGGGNSTSRRSHRLGHHREAAKHPALTRGALDWIPLMDVHEH